MSSALLHAYLDNPAPTVDEARAVFRPLTNGDYTDIEIAALLATIRTRGETFADLAGAAYAFLDAARDFPHQGQGLLDTAGTGGDRANTINISTGASLVAAACGARVVKCGNRSISSRSGSADVLEALNIPLDLDVQRAARQFEHAGFTFLFAPAYHPAIAHVMPVRRALRVPTLFNTLGPILSPARPQFQTMGVANPAVGRLVAEVLRELGRDRALVFHGAGTDEIAVHGPTQFWEVRDGEIVEFVRTPAELGVAEHTLDDLRGGDGADNARALRAVFAGSAPAAHRDAIAVNAGAMLHTVGLADDLAAGTARALTALADGTVQTWLQRHEEADYAR